MKSNSVFRLDLYIYFTRIYNSFNWEVFVHSIGKNFNSFVDSMKKTVMVIQTNKEYYGSSISYEIVLKTDAQNHHQKGT